MEIEGGAVGYPLCTTPVMGKWWLKYWPTADNVDTNFGELGKLFICWPTAEDEKNYQQLAPNFLASCDRNRRGAVGYPQSSRCSPSVVVTQILRSCANLFPPSAPSGYDQVATQIFSDHLRCLQTMIKFISNWHLISQHPFCYGQVAI